MAQWLGFLALTGSPGQGPKIPQVRKKNKGRAEISIFQEMGKDKCGGSEWGVGVNRRVMDEEKTLLLFVAFYKTLWATRIHFDPVSWT